MGHYTLFEACFTYLEACFILETFGARTLDSRHALHIWRELCIRTHHVAWLTWSNPLNKELMHTLTKYKYGKWTYAAKKEAPSQTWTYKLKKVQM